jgi:hypothetical protein
MAHAPFEQKALMGFNEIKYFKSQRSMRIFAENESLDKRLLMLARLGYTFAVTVCPIDKLDVLEDVLAQTKNQYKQGKGGTRKELIQTMHKNGIFFFSSKDVMTSIMMAADNTHTDIFVLNYDYVRLNQHIIDVKGESDTNNMAEAVKASTELAKMNLAALNTDETIVQAICGCSIYELKILLALYPDKNNYVSIKTLSLRVHQVVRDRNKGVAKICYKLEQKKWISRLPGFDGKHLRQTFTIMELGMQAVGKYQKYILNKIKSL